MKKLVLFDFDGTLTTRDTLRPFARHIVNNHKGWFRLPCLWVLLAVYRLKLISDRRLKENYLTLFVKGFSTTEAESLAKSFINNELDKLINRRTFDILKKHIESEDRVFIVSANFDFLLAPLVDKWNISGIISIETEKSGLCFTGRIIGTTCKGSDKVRKVIDYLGSDSIQNAVAYGDEEDTELLAVVEKGIRVK